MAEVKRSAPTLAEFIRGFPEKKSAAYIEDNFATLEPKTSLDFAIMEKAHAVETVVAEFDWDDVGLWTALPKHAVADEAGNTAKGNVIVSEAKNNIAISTGRMIALCGVNDLVVVETADAVLVCHRDAVHDIKKLIGRLPKEFL